MIVDPAAQALHHKSTLGGVLTPDEQERLRQWYAKMDEEEAAMFARSQKPEDVRFLQAEIDETTSQIIAEAQKIQALERENERIRGEIISFHRHAAQGFDHRQEYDS